MTREEAIIFINTAKAIVVRNTDCCEKVLKSLDIAISALSENKGEWIPTTERLPEIGDTVLCSVKTHESDHRIIICKYCAEKFWKDGRIRAWQPLPEPYKEES